MRLYVTFCHVIRDILPQNATASLPTSAPLYTSASATSSSSAFSTASPVSVGTSGKDFGIAFSSTVKSQNYAKQARNRKKQACFPGNRPMHLLCLVQNHSLNGLAYLQESWCKYNNISTCSLSPTTRRTHIIIFVPVAMRMALVLLTSRAIWMVHLGKGCNC